jgi:hypothetical protein
MRNTFFIGKTTKSLEQIRHISCILMIAIACVAMTTNCSKSAVPIAPEIADFVPKTAMHVTNKTYDATEGTSRSSTFTVTDELDTFLVNVKTTATQKGYVEAANRTDQNRRTLAFRADNDRTLTVTTEVANGTTTAVITYLSPQK